MRDHRILIEFWLFFVLFCKNLVPISFLFKYNCIVRGFQPKTEQLSGSILIY